MSSRGRLGRGLEEERYSWSAVLHREADGGVHVHVLAARCDLETGKSLNIAPPGWQKTFDALRDSLNYEHGWSRPGRSGPGAGDPAGAPGRSGGNSATRRPERRARAEGTDPGIPGREDRERGRPGPRGRGGCVAGGGPGGAPPGEALHHGAGSGERVPVALEGGDL